MTGSDSPPRAGAEVPLTSEVQTPHSLDEETLAAMLALQQEHYHGVEEGVFRSDLAEKDHVLLLRAGGKLVGFSTQVTLRTHREGTPARALFSGDTVIHHGFWGSQELVRAWCRYAGWILAQEPEVPLYWFLISKGHRTYLYLPLFFRRFIPSRAAAADPHEQALLDRLAADRYGAAYDPGTGLIRGTHHDRLRPELDTGGARAHHPDVAYFLQRNPHYAQGDELACLAEISPDNMRGAARRYLLEGMASSRGS